MPEKQKCECVGWTEKKEEEESLSTQVGRLSRASPSTVAVLVQQVLPGAGKNVENRLPTPPPLSQSVSTQERRGYLGYGSGCSLATVEQRGLQPERSIGNAAVPQMNALQS